MTRFGFPSGVFFFVAVRLFAQRPAWFSTFPTCLLCCVLEGASFFCVFPLTRVFRRRGFSGVSYSPLWFSFLFFRRLFPDVGLSRLWLVPFFFLKVPPVNSPIVILFLTSGRDGCTLGFCWFCFSVFFLNGSEKGFRFFPPAFPGTCFFLRSLNFLG